MFLADIIGRFIHTPSPSDTSISKDSELGLFPWYQLTVLALEALISTVQHAQISLVTQTIRLITLVPKNFSVNVRILEYLPEDYQERSTLKLITVISTCKEFYDEFQYGTRNTKTLSSCPTKINFTTSLKNWATINVGSYMD